MTEEDIREYCISKPGAAEDLPFGPDTLVFKVNNKLFLLMGLDKHPITFNVKCDPDKAIELRERYDAVQPGYHMNKKHWNTIIVDGTLSTKQLKEFIDDSYGLVVKNKK
ncbi:MmcQ/YjbR family DNA-binding protein [Mucilaginibacter sp. HMF5004]|uniref:MmcQ/YjbR family DNA-binding protein n=1 Tax=Mucilaginibacter rivuli TaxID=2857527 RepID=UPI001C5F1025|nr:MmcQ/YjbR family DNA-binding protein [Mucilaginibacter rivuli]MBW4888795.1 MmcQ/YjbR family DNA-binding protein [Mucilaginibacter rivuli]